jgi:hypothetical protein
VKKIVLSILGLMLIVNAGFDFSRFVNRRMTENKIQSDFDLITAQFPGATMQLHGCANIPSYGWACNVELGAPDGRHKSFIQPFSYEDLKN